MEEVKVADIAKELECESKELVAFAQDMKLDVKTYNSKLTLGQADRLKSAWKKRHRDGGDGGAAASSHSSQRGHSRLARGASASAPSHLGRRRIGVDKGSTGTAVAAKSSGVGDATQESDAEHSGEGESSGMETAGAEASDTDSGELVTGATTEAATGVPAQGTAVEEPTAQAAMPPATAETVAAEAPPKPADVNTDTGGSAAATPPPLNPPNSPIPTVPPPQPAGPTTRPGRMHESRAAIAAKSAIMQAIPEGILPVNPEDKDKFGVVVSSNVAEHLYGPVQAPRGGRAKPERAAAGAPRTGAAHGQEVVSKAAVDTFTPKVYYPKLRGEVKEEAPLPGLGGSKARAEYKRTGKSRLMAQITQEDDGSRRAGTRRFGKRGRGEELQKQPVVVAKKPSGKVDIVPPINLRTLSEVMGVKVSEISAKLLLEGKLVGINQTLPEQDAQLIAYEFGIELNIKKAADVEDEVATVMAAEDPEAQLEPRAPIVAILGHVDHGKTTLMDYIRKTHVAAGEAGGITQHIGAYRVKVGEKFVCFLDTPGHEAFSAMRARGAQTTDIVVLVVDGQDGVMPQTLESLAHARAAGVKIVVAITKMDKAGADAEKVKAQLASHGLSPVEWDQEKGVEMIPISALAGTNVDTLLETLALETEIMNLRANPHKAAQGVVLEAHTDPGEGVVATLLVLAGTLKTGDIVVAGSGYGRVRQMQDDLRRPMDETRPSTPVRVLGLSEVPAAGDKFVVLDELKKAMDIASERQRKERVANIAQRMGSALERFKLHLEQGQAAVLNLIIKSDVIGSIEPIVNSLNELSTGEVKVKILHQATGGINLSDVTLAEASDALIMGFNVSADSQVRNAASKAMVEIRLYNIIYEMINDVRRIMTGMLQPEKRLVPKSEVEVRQVFKVTKVGTVAGCYVRNGTISRSQNVRLVRDGKVVWPQGDKEGKVESLKRHKDDVREVREGFECGIRLDGFEDVKQGDVIESYEVEFEARTSL
ncbi:MAG: translation initiation factor IF-2 [Planctomycetota bacterium]